MSQRWKLWFEQRGRRIGAIFGALLLALLALWIATGDSSAGLAFLEDVTRPREDAAVSNGAMLPRAVDLNAPLAEAPSSAASTLLDTPAGASGGPQDIATAQAAWSAEELAQHQQQILAALNCARQQQGARSLTLDPTLTQAAGDAWLQLTRERSFSLMQLPGAYSLRSVMTLDFAVDPACASEESEPGEVASMACGVGGFDAATLEVAAQASRIGIAVFPPQATWDGSSAVVLVRIAWPAGEVLDFTPRVQIILNPSAPAYPGYRFRAHVQDWSFVSSVGQAAVTAPDGMGRAGCRGAPGSATWLPTRDAGAIGPGIRRQTPIQGEPQPNLRPLLLVVVEPDEMVLNMLIGIAARLRAVPATPVHLLVVQTHVSNAGREVYAQLPALITSGGCRCGDRPCRRHDQTGPATPPCQGGCGAGNRAGRSAGRCRIGPEQWYACLRWCRRRRQRGINTRGASSCARAGFHAGLAAA